MRAKTLSLTLGATFVLAALSWNHLAAAPRLAGSELEDALQRAQLEQELVLAERTAVMLGNLLSAERRGGER